MESSAAEHPLPIPFPNSYWVIPGRLLAGPYPGAPQPQLAEQRLSNLAGCGIRHVINLMEANEVNHEGLPFAPYLDRLNHFAAMNGGSISMNRYPIKDVSIPSREMMKQILDEIDARMTAGCPVYVHCWGGKGRTGTVIGCYLIRHNLATSESVIQRLDQLRRHIEPRHFVPETKEQRAYVRAWAE